MHISPTPHVISLHPPVPLICSPASHAGQFAALPDRYPMSFAQSTKEMS